MKPETDTPMAPSAKQTDTGKKRGGWGIYLFCATALVLEIGLMVYMATAVVGLGLSPIIGMSLLAVTVAHLGGVCLYVLYQRIQVRKARRGVLMPLGSICLATVLWTMVIVFASDYKVHVRRKWKDRAVSEITKRAGDPTWLGDEIQGLKDDHWWQSDDLLLMADGEWLVFKHEDAKRDWRIDDIFIAKGSDGKWYYSTFHFCINMVALQMCQDVQPADLGYFVKEYRLETFDGASDECLKKTGSMPYSMEAVHK